MNNRIATAFLSAVLLGAAVRLTAQETPSNPPQKKVDDPSEFAKFTDSCNSFQFSKIGSCAELLFTGHPVHIAVGSLAPQNGFGAGLALVGVIPPTESWRPTWNADAVAAPNGSWRAGMYFKFVHTPDFKTIVHHGKPKIKSNLTELPEHTVVNLYAQAISLNKLTFFGIGSGTSEAGRSNFGMREVIAGANVVKPFAGKLNFSMLGEMNGRFVDIRQSVGNGSPSIETLYSDATAPGLTTQPGFLQFGESARMRPIVWDDRLHFNYQASFLEFVAPGNSRFSFERFNLDLSHDFAIYASTTRIPVQRDPNGPDECSIARFDEFPGCALDKKEQIQNCEKDKSKRPEECKTISRDLQGSIGFRFVLSKSIVPSGNTVPFFFQPTLGGSDINGNPSLSSYQDYRFRAPDVLFLRESFEHSIWNLPIGFTLMADEGKVALTLGGLGSSRWIHSYSAGLTLRAGGFPQVYLLFSWGGNEGTHTIANVNTSLLGGTSRPSLF
jgi:hypothetical protein